MYIRKRLNLNVIVIILVGILIVVMFYIISQRIYTLYQKRSLAAEIIRGVAELKIIEDEYLLYPEDRIKKQWELKYFSLDSLLQKQHFTRPENKALFSKILSNHYRVKHLFSQIIDLHGNNNLSYKNKDVSNSILKDRLITLLLESSQEMVSTAFTLGRNIERSILAFQKSIRTIGFILIISLFGFIVYHSVYVRKRITTAIDKLLKGTRIVGNGNLDYKIKIEKEDEFGKLANSFNNMAENLKRSTTSIDKLNREIQSRKKIEEELKKKKEELNLILDSPPIMIFYKDMDGRYLFVNKAFSSAMGKSREEIIGKKSIDLFSKETAERLDMHDRELLRFGKSELRTVEKYETPRGIRWARVIKIPLYGKNGKPEKIVGFAEDITDQKLLEEEKKKLEAQLFQAQKMEAIGRLTGGIAHDFNNMLTIILGYTDYILSLSKIKKTDFIYQLLQDIKKASLRSAELTQKLLAFSRQQIISPKRLDLNKELIETEKLLKRIIGEDIDLKLLLQDGLWDTFLDSSQVNQIVLNMVVNARDAMPDGGIITIETSNIKIDEDYCKQHLGITPGDYVILAISDTGVGMDKKTLAHLYEPFFTTKGQGKGTGLGLATVYGIVKQNNGYINCYSEPGKGTTFKIFFPRFTGEEEKASVTIEEIKIPKGNETILLVEDEDIVREFARDALKYYGYNVLEASNPKDAINMCKEYDKDIHMLFTDVVMPDMDGKKLYEIITSIRPGIKVLFTSGYTPNAVVHRGILEKETPFIHKPFTMNSLAKSVREVLDNKQ